MNRPFFRILPSLLLLVLFSPLCVSADTTLPSTIAADRTLTLSGSPYIVSGQTTVSSGATLSIDPGVIVKFGSFGWFEVQGSLAVNGTTASPVNFTSFSDDSLGGDSNGDGNATGPAGWIGVRFDAGSTGTVSHLISQYGAVGTGAQMSNEGTVSIADSTFQHGFGSEDFFQDSNGSSTISTTEFTQRSNLYSIVAKGGTLNLIQSHIHDNNAQGVWIQNATVDVENSTFENNGSDAVFVTYPATFIHHNNHVSGNSHNSFSVTGTIQSDTEWNNDNDIPYAPYDLNVAPSVTLTVDPGAIVKFFSNTGAGTQIAGTLNALGTAIKPIHFTSFNDDMVGGDSGNDGNTTPPAQADWQPIYILGGGTATVSHADISYGGHSTGAALYNEGGTLNLDSVTFHHSSTDLYNSDGNTTVNNSQFVVTSGGFGVHFDGGSLAIHGSAFYPQNDIGSAFSIYTSFATPVVVDATNNWWGDTSGPKHPLNPSGVGMGVGDKVTFTPWLTSDPFATSSTPSTGITKPVIIIPGILGSQQQDGVWVLDPIRHIYDNLVDTLEANGYKASTTLFTFPYDWHSSNVSTAILLKSKIDEIKAVCSCNKVDLVAHSMGGLVARQYIQSPAYQNDVDHLIFLGTPQLGAPESYLTWEGGEIDPTDKNSGFEKFFLEREGSKFGFGDLFDYVQHKPITSVRELLPSYSYLKDKTTNQIRSYPLGYPINNFLDALAQNTPALLSSGVKISNFVGDIGTTTIGTIRVVATNSYPMWANGYPDGFTSSTSTDNGLERVEGDGTVPLSSAEAITQDLVSRPFSHNDLPTQFSDLVFQRLTGAASSTIVNNPDSINYRFILIRILSPANIVVIAPDGKRVGKDFATSQEVNEIPGAFYSGFNNNNNEYVTIPNPSNGQYQINTIGTGNGEYTLQTSSINDNAVSQSSFTGITQPNLQESVSFTLNSATTSPVVITPGDQIPPLVTITSPLAGDYDRSQTVTVSASSTDNTGVATSTLLFAGRQIANPSNIDLFFEKLGTTTVVATTIDFENNIATSTLDIRVVATASSTISDINRAFTLGWIYKSNIRDELIKKLLTVLKAQSKIVTITEKVNGKNTTKKVTRIEMVIDKTLGRALLLDLKAYQKDKINDQAYNLIKDDLMWLLNN